MPTQIDLEKIIEENPQVDSEELKKGQEALRELYRSGVVQRSTYELDTPESKGNIRHCEDTGDLSHFHRIR
jgi:hypothetical protein